MPFSCEAIRKLNKRQKDLQRRNEAEAAKCVLVRSITPDQEGHAREILSRRRAASQASISKADPLLRNLRRDIRTLRSKLLPRKVLKTFGKPAPRRKKNKGAPPVGAKPESIIPNSTYVENGWHVCGFCSIWTASRVNFAEHEISARHKRAVALKDIPDSCMCPCGKKSDNSFHAYQPF